MKSAEPDLKLHDCVIKTCGFFLYLNAACGDTCHPYYPHRRMSLFDLPDGSLAWVCHEIERAICSERSAESHVRRKTRGGRMHVTVFGAGDCPED